MRKSIFALILFVLMFISVACGFLVDDNQWEEGHGDLPSALGGEDLSFNGMLIPDYQDFIDFDKVSEQLFDGATSGEWFGAGALGYGLPSGTMGSGDSFEVVVIGHDPDGVEVNRDMRVRFYEIFEGYELGDLVLDEEIFVDQVNGTEEIFTGELPEKENISYVASLEVLDESGEVEDMLFGLIYVPTPEVNVDLSLDQDVFEYVDDVKEREEVMVTLSLENFGPTFLSFGKDFMIEKLVEDTWRVAPLGLSFESIGVNLGVDDSFEQTYDVSELRRGTYRFVKEFSVDGLDEKQTLAVEFKVE